MLRKKNSMLKLYRLFNSLLLLLLYPTIMAHFKQTIVSYFFLLSFLFVLSHKMCVDYRIKVTLLRDWHYWYNNLYITTKKKVLQMSSTNRHAPYSFFLCYKFCLCITAISILADCFFDLVDRHRP